jgi:hypothetical protein
VALTALGGLPAGPWAYQGPTLVRSGTLRTGVGETREVYRESSACSSRPARNSSARSCLPSMSWAWASCRCGGCGPSVPAPTSSRAPAPRTHHPTARQLAVRCAILLSAVLTAATFVHGPPSPAAEPSSVAPEYESAAAAQGRVLGGGLSLHARRARRGLGLLSPAGARPWTCGTLLAGAPPDRRVAP